MLKKFLLAALSAVIILSSFVTAQAAEYKDVHTYAYSEGGVDYYVETVMAVDARLGSMVFGYQNGKVVKALAFIFIYDSAKEDFHYEILNDDGTEIDSGYLSNKEKVKAGAVFVIASKVAGH